MIPRLFRGLRISAYEAATTGVFTRPSARSNSSTWNRVRQFSTDIPSVDPLVRMSKMELDALVKQGDFVGAWWAYCQNSSIANSTLALDTKSRISEIIREVPLDVLLEAYEQHVLSSPHIVLISEIVCAGQVGRVGGGSCVSSIMTSLRLNDSSITQNMLSSLVDCYLAENMFYKALAAAEGAPQEYSVEVSHISVFSLVQFLTRCVVPKSKRLSSGSTFTTPADVPRHSKWNPVFLAIDVARAHEQNQPKRHQSKVWSMIVEACFEAEMSVLAAQLMEECVDRGVSLGTPVLQALVKHTAENGDIPTAKKIFNYSFSTQSPPSMSTVNALVRGFLENDDLNEAVKFIENIVNTNMASLDLSTIKIFLQYFVNLGDFDGVRLVLNIISHHRIPIDYGVINLIFMSLGSSFDPVRIRMLLDSILEQGLVPPVITYTNAIRSLCHMGAIDAGKHLYSEMTRLGVEPNVVTYTTVIQALAEHGRFFEAWNVKNEMIARGVQPNEFTYKVLLRRSSYAVELSYYLQTILEMTRYKFRVDPFFVKHCAKLLLFQKKHAMLRQLADAVGQPVDALTKHAVDMEHDARAGADWVHLDSQHITTTHTHLTGLDTPLHTPSPTQDTYNTEELYVDIAGARKLNKSGLKLAQANYKRVTKRSNI